MEEGEQQAAHRKVNACTGHSSIQQLNQLLHSLACRADGDGNCTLRAGQALQFIEPHHLALGPACRAQLRAE
jgi:hypothetical protein